MLADVSVPRHLLPQQLTPSAPFLSTITSISSLSHSLRPDTRQRLLHHQRDTEQRADDDGTRSHTLQQRSSALLAYDPSNRREPALVRLDAGRGSSLEASFDDIQRGRSAGSNDTGTGTGDESSRAADGTLVVHKLSSEDAVEGEVDDGEGAISHEGRDSSFVHSSDSHLADELGEDRHLIDRLPWGGLVHLHADLGDLHGSGDDDLAGSREASSCSFQQDVSLGVYGGIINLEEVAKEVVPGQLDCLLGHDADHVGGEAAVEPAGSSFPEDGHEAVAQSLEFPRMVHLKLGLSEIEGVDSSRSCNSSCR
mmetsp:Transcript_22127/g.49929  ORF Transcript_22127/g.49929 Transcript_22127/m.49929 type:complete len:310 (-) Transcript_22127:135-1064(-)